MDFVCLLFGVLFFAAGGLFYGGKGHIHLAVWKQMSNEEKERILIRPLCRNIGTMILLCAAIFLAGGVWTFFKHHLFVFAMIGWMIVSGLDVLYIGKSKRYQRKPSAVR